MTRTLLATAALALMGCRPEPGPAQYPDWSTADDTGAEALPEGPDPYEEGEARLSIGLHYESGYSDLIDIDDQTNHYYIYEGTYSESIDTQDVVEGRQSGVIIHGDVGWFGGGVTWDVPQDLSAWTTMFVSMRSSDEGFADFDIVMNGGGNEARVAASSVGWAADGQWHHLEIPLADFAASGADLSTVGGPFVLLGEGGGDGDELKIDNLYFTQD